MSNNEKIVARWATIWMFFILALFVGATAFPQQASMLFIAAILAVLAFIMVWD